MRTLRYICNRVHCASSGPWPFNLSFCHPFSILTGQKFYGPNIRSVKTCVLGPLHPLSPSVPAEAGHQFQLLLGHPCVWLWGEPASSYFSIWLVILLFLIDVTDACYHDHNMPWFWFKHIRNFEVFATWLLPPWQQCTLYVCSNFKPLCYKVTSASNMYAANPG